MLSTESYDGRRTADDGLEATSRASVVRGRSSIVRLLSTQHSALILGSASTQLRGTRMEGLARRCADCSVPGARGSSIEPTGQARHADRAGAPARGTTERIANLIECAYLCRHSGGRGAICWRASTQGADQ